MVNARIRLRVAHRFTLTPELRGRECSNHRMQTWSINFYDSFSINVRVSKLKLTSPFCHEVTDSSRSVGHHSSAWATSARMIKTSWHQSFYLIGEAQQSLMSSISRDIFEADDRAKGMRYHISRTVTMVFRNDGNNRKWWKRNLYEQQGAEKDVWWVLKAVSSPIPISQFPRRLILLAILLMNYLKNKIGLVLVNLT